MLGGVGDDLHRVHLRSLPVWLAAVERVLTTLRFFHESEQGPDPGATGYRGFYYHFLDVRTGHRAWNCELSTIDTAILLAGALTSASYFDGSSPEERELRRFIYRLVRTAFG